MYLSLHYANDNPAPIKYIDDVLNCCAECQSDLFIGKGKNFVCQECGHIAVFR